MFKLESETRHHHPSGRKQILTLECVKKRKLDAILTRQKSVTYHILDFLFHCAWLSIHTRFSNILTLGKKALLPCTCCTRSYD